jgi:acetylornithine deacetylase/succinyl-diaminopimelate desuccinylase-like protein
MPEAAFDPAAIAADAVALAELPGGTGHEQVRIDWLQERLEHAPGSRYVDGVGNLVWAFGRPPYRLAVLVHVDDVFDEATERGVTRRDGWLCGPGIGDNAIAVATTVAVAERELAGPGPLPVAVTHPLVAAVLRARSSIGLPVTTADGSTDANAALAAGIPAVALGCCRGENMHAPTERIRADSIATGAAQLRAVLAEVLAPS